MHWGLWDCHCHQAMEGGLLLATVVIYNTYGACFGQSKISVLLLVWLVCVWQFEICPASQNDAVKTDM